MIVNWRIAKSTLLDKPLEQKRQLYKCRGRFKTLDNIINWGAYVRTAEARAKLASYFAAKDSQKKTKNNRTDAAQSNARVSGDSETTKINKGDGQSENVKDSFDASNEKTSTDESKPDDKSKTCADIEKVGAVDAGTSTAVAKATTSEDTAEIKMDAMSQTSSIDEDETVDRSAKREKMDAMSQTSSFDEGETVDRSAKHDETEKMDVLGVGESSKVGDKSSTTEDPAKIEMEVKSETPDGGERSSSSAVVPYEGARRARPVVHPAENAFPVNDVLNGKVSLFIGDITCLEIDAIVNAANEDLYCGGGVDNAIHTAAGYAYLRAECDELNGCDTGDAKITGGYKLPAKYVIHAVGPRGEYPALLRNCYNRSMDLLKEHELETIAFPCISTGIYGYPNGAAANVALETIRKWLEDDEYSAKVKRVIFCLFLPSDIDIYHNLMPKYFPFE